MTVVGHGLFGPRAREIPFRCPRIYARAACSRGFSHAHHDFCSFLR